ncbi:MAG TPA: 1-deoxy-D-xylulose-5-phosphate reductoisomerase [Armatimonadota bacterium]|jgi:1-deoxy-D-xylulose-5-phosphate reductoisomerase
MNREPLGIAVLGCTGSIGTQTLDVALQFPDRLRVVALAADSSGAMVAEQAARHQPCLLSMMQPEAAASLRGLCPRATVLEGMDGLIAAATHPDVHTVVVSVKGSIGLLPTLAALKAGKNVALASKEVLVAAGELVMRTARENGAAVLPIDSEHSALFQCLNGEAPDTVEKLILTASGGPFRTWPVEDIASVTPEQALAHPTWNMGPKITVDCATLMNKGLEVIEAHWLFDVPAERISVVIHPQSVIHSMVQFVDGSVIAQLGVPDMRLPIQYALFYPERAANDLPRLDLAAIGRLAFESPDTDRFPGLGLAFEAARIGQSLPAVFSAANEEAVALFLSGHMAFTGIVDVVRKTMRSHTAVPLDTVESVLAVDAWARQYARSAGEGLNVAPANG